MSYSDAPWDDSFTPDLAEAARALPRVSNYHKLLTAAGAGNLADGIFKFALPVLAVNLTANRVLVSSVTAALTLPWLFASLPAGVLADRADRLRTMIRSNAVRTAVLALFAIGIALEVQSIALVILVALALGLMEVTFDTSAQAMVPNLVPDNLLGRANARLMTLEFSMNQMVGKAVGGWLAGFALYAAFGTAAAAYFVGSLALLSIVGKFKPASNRSPDKTIRSDIAEGFRFLNKQTILRNMALLFAIMEFFYEGVLAVLPLFALARRDGALNLTAAQFGLLTASIAVGGLIGSLVADRIETKFHPIKSLSICMMLVALQVATLAFTTNIWIITAATTVVGAASLVFTVLTITMRQRLIPDELRGRVNSIYRLAVFGAMSLGALTGGIIAQATSIKTFFIVAFVAIVGVTVVLPLMIRPYNRAIANASAA